MVKRVEPQAGQPDAQRAWRVDIGPDPRRAACSAPSCPGPLHPTGRTTHEIVLAHLAAHAQHEPLANHLRTCRCHAHGCTWHPRHRGCTGPIVLTVFRQHHGRTWQLADTCTGCARTIPHAAPVPDPRPQTGARAPSPKPKRPAQPGEHGGCADTCARQAALLRAVLCYLEAALSPPAPAAARILALACLLRADAEGAARLPRGLLRALRLAHHSSHLAAALAQEQWLRPAEHRPDASGAGLTVQLNDPAASAALADTSRRVRRALFDRASKLLTHSQVRGLDCASRLAALQLALSPGSAGDGAVLPPGDGCAHCPAAGDPASGHPPHAQAMRGAQGPRPAQGIGRTTAPARASRSAPVGVVSPA